MPTWLAIVLIALAALILLFLLGGLIAVRRRNALYGDRMLRDIAQANEALAQARAGDRGWDRDAIDAAARTAQLAVHPDARIEAVHLIQVVDRPGTEDDEAHVRVLDATGAHVLVLGRRGDSWVATAHEHV
jgi:hypothetical protein